MKITLFVAALAITAQESQVAAVELNGRTKSNGVTSSDTMGLAQTSDLFEFKRDWGAPDAAGVAMALIGGIFQGFGIADQFMAGREQKQDILSAVGDENKSTNGHLS